MCEDYIFGKEKIVSFQTKGTPKKVKLELVYPNVWTNICVIY